MNSIVEIWKDVKEYEGRYQISNLGRIKSIPFYQRYVLKNGKTNYRLTKEKMLATQIGRHGYELVCLNLNNVRKGRSVHSLVAEVFVSGEGETVNHKNGKKADNRAENLEWCSYTANHLHAVALGLNKQAIAVRDPATNKIYNSIAQAAKHCRKNHRDIRAKFVKVII